MTYYTFFFIYFYGDRMYLIANGGIGLIGNTSDAIMLTKNISYIDGIKIDVRMSLDNVLVLSSFNELFHLTFSNKKVTEVNYDYLKKVKFQSHIFKYYIPTLDEILKKYSKDKIIILELHEEERINSFIQELIHIISQYSYNYYFYSTNNLLLESLKDYGTIIKEYYHKQSDIMTDKFIISNNPLKYLRQ